MSDKHPIPIDDLFLIWSELRLIAKSVAELLGTDKMTPHAEKLQHFKDKVVEWSECYAAVEESRRTWEIRRTEHEQHALTQRRLLDEDAGSPDEGWSFEQFRLRDIANEALTSGVEPVMLFHSPSEPLIGAWFPTELCWDNCPEAALPLPPSADPPTLCERYAALAAIHDCFAKSRQKIDPWARADKDDSISIEDYTEKIVPHASRYDALKDVVRQCEDSESCSWLKGYEPTGEQIESKATLSAWLDDAREDLQASVGAAPQGDGDVGDGANAESVQPNFPNPSRPMSKKQAVGEWGGAMTVDKLTSLIKSERVRCQELNRQLFIFCCDDVPNLEPSHKN